MKKFLVLADGSVFEGVGFGADRDAVGELVFTTGVCGYIETLTDPSYYGQIVMQTFPQIGNYGVIREDFEGKPALFGYVTREYCDAPSNFRCGGTLDAFLRESGIPAICGVDTREITRRIRESGTMNAAMCSEVPADLSAIKAYSVKDAVAAVSRRDSAVFPALNGERFRVALIDYGAKGHIVQCLRERGCSVTELPFDVTAEYILSNGFDGVMLSNGPGDPAENAAAVAELKKLLGKLPIFGICLGHQLLALAAGGRTVKLPYGHRGANQPVRDLESGRVYITSQNHGYAADGSIPGATELFKNANDGTNEGLAYPGLQALSVQFHPEASAGPHDAGFMFDRFIQLMEDNK